MNCETATYEVVKYKIRKGIPLPEIESAAWECSLIVFRRKIKKLKRVAEFVYTLKSPLQCQLRIRPIVAARWLVFDWLKQNENYTSIKIASLYNCDHSTVLNGINKVKDCEVFDPELFRLKVMFYEKIAGI